MPAPKPTPPIKIAPCQKHIIANCVTLLRVVRRITKHICPHENIK
jgi:hypothetical protein